jgi:hypothetical protein
MASIKIGLMMSEISILRRILQPQRESMRKLQQIAKLLLLLLLLLLKNQGGTHEKELKVK